MREKRNDRRIVEEKGMEQENRGRRREKGGEKGTKASLIKHEF